MRLRDFVSASVRAGYGRRMGDYDRFVDSLGFGWNEKTPVAVIVLNWELGAESRGDTFLVDWIE